MDFNLDFFKITGKQVVQKGSVLISEPFLNDTYFKRSVVILTEHSKEGSIGFVLNKQVDLKVQNVIQDFPEIDTGICIGGPVNTNTIHYIHTLGDLIPESVLVKDNIYWGGSFEVLKQMIASGNVKKQQAMHFHPIRFQAD